LHSYILFNAIYYSADQRILVSSTLRDMEIRAIEKMWYREWSDCNSNHRGGDRGEGRRARRVKTKSKQGDAYIATAASARHIGAFNISPSSVSASEIRCSANEVISVARSSETASADLFFRTNSVSLSTGSRAISFGFHRERDVV